MNQMEQQNILLIKNLIEFGSSYYDAERHIGDQWRGYTVKFFVSADYANKIWYSICDINTVIYFSSKDNKYFDNSVTGINEAIIEAQNMIEGGF